MTFLPVLPLLLTACAHHSVVPMPASAPAPTPAPPPAATLPPEAPPPEPAPPPSIPPAPAHPLCTDPWVQDLARGARHWANTELGTEDYGTGGALFDREWLFGTWMMAAVGLGQHAQLCPDDAPADLTAMEAALERMVSPEGRAFDTHEYDGVDIDERLGDPHGSVALLGYGGLALALHRSLDPDSPLATIEQRWAEALALRMNGGLLETYPRQIFPVDNAAGVAALALHDRVTGEDHGAQLAATTTAIAAARDPTTGMLFQVVAADGHPLDEPKGSGSFLTAWFLQRAAPDLALDLYTTSRDTLSGSLMGLRAMREYAPGTEGGGSVDSGPLIFGFSVSATGFALGAAAALGDTDTRDALRTTAQLGGDMAVGMVAGLAAPTGDGATGSHLGDAIMLAMITSEGMP